MNAQAQTVPTGAHRVSGNGACTSWVSRNGKGHFAQVAALQDDTRVKEREE
jgi:hypothetical protein